MHEMTIATTLVDQVCHQAEILGATRVAEINLRMGVLNGIGARFIFASHRRRAIRCARARTLILDEVPLTVLCTYCEAVEARRRSTIFAAPIAGSPDSESADGP